MKTSDPSSTVHSAKELEISWLNDPLNYAVRSFIAFLQTIFEGAEQGCFRWMPMMEESEIIITEDNPVHVDSVEQRPAISVILGPTRFNGSSLDDLVSLDATNAKEVHTDLLPGTMTLNCLSRVPQEARFIGWICARTIWNLRKLFIKESHIHEVGRNIGVGSVSPAGALVVGDTEGEWHSVSVTCPFFLQWTDSVTPLKNDWTGREIQKLHNIEHRFQTRLGVAQPNLTNKQDTGPKLWGAQANTLRPPSIRGKAIKS